MYLAVSALRGWGRGLVAMAAGLAAFIASLALARVFSAPLAKYLDQHFGFQRSVQAALAHVSPVTVMGTHTISVTAAAVVTAVSFLGILLAAEGVLGIVVAVIGGIPNRIPLVRPLNRLTGAVFGAAEAAAVTAAVLVLLEPLARAGALGALGPYITGAPLAQSLWHLGQHFEPFLQRLP